MRTPGMVSGIAETTRGVQLGAAAFQHLRNFYYRSFSSKHILVRRMLLLCRY